MFSVVRRRDIEQSEMKSSRKIKSRLLPFFSRMLLLGRIHTVKDVLSHFSITGEQSGAPKSEAGASGDGWWVV